MSRNNEQVVEKLMSVNKPICFILTSEGKIILLEGEPRAVLRVELGKPSSMLEYELIFLDQQWLQIVPLVVPD